MLVLIAVLKGAMPQVAMLAAFVLVPATGVAAFVAQNLLSEPRITPYLWPLVVPAAAPPIMIAFSLWALIPGLRRVVPAAIAVAVFIAGLAGVCIALGPMLNARNVEVAQLNAEARRSNRPMRAFPRPPRWPSCCRSSNTRNAVREDEVLDRIKQRPQRQGETEAMLARGEFPLKLSRPHRPRPDAGRFATRRAPTCAGA